MTIGADVPYCIMRGTALAEESARNLRRLIPCQKCYILIAKPGISVSTKFVYGALDADHLTHHPDIDGMIKAIDEQNLEGIAGCMENVLETVTVEKYPVIQTIKDMMMADGAYECHDERKRTYGIWNI